jgi:hypothetical protein
MGPCLGRHLGTTHDTARHENVSGLYSVGPHRAGPDRARAGLGTDGPFGILYRHPIWIRDRLKRAMETGRGQRADHVFCTDFFRSSSVTYRSNGATARALPSRRSNGIERKRRSVAGIFRVPRRSLTPINVSDFPHLNRVVVLFELVLEMPRVSMKGIEFGT